MSWAGRGGNKALNAWRNHPLLRPNSVWEYLPGLKKALVVFGAYVVIDTGYNAMTKKKHGGHEGHSDHHGDDHHEETKERAWTKTVTTSPPRHKTISTSAFPIYRETSLFDRLASVDTFPSE